MNEQEEQWLTGFTEGDGSIGLWPRLRIAYSQKEHEVLNYIQRLASNGNFYKTNNRGFAHGNVIYRLEYNGRNAAPILATVARNVVSSHTCERVNTILKTLKVAVHEPTIDWLAGFFDADGGSDDAPSLYIGQKEREVLETVKRKFGGAVYIQKNSFRWYLYGNNARTLLLELAPRSHNPPKTRHTLELFEGPTHHETHKEERHTYYKKNYELVKAYQALLREHPEVVVEHQGHHEQKA